jgi:hypothetical protein
MISTQWLWVCFFIHPHCCKCRMVIALTFRDVAKHLKLGGGVVNRNLPEIWTSMLKINLKCNNYNRAFSDWFPLSYYSKFPTKREVSFRRKKITTAQKITTLLCKFYLKMSKFKLEFYPSFTVGVHPPSPTLLCPCWS